MDEARSALIIASSRYEDGVLRRLEAPANDADALARALADPAIGNFDVRTLLDERASEAMQEIEAFFDARGREDLLFLYFSGHGLLDEASRLYFATVDTRTDRPRSTAIPAAFIHELMDECRSRRQVLVLDCCNSGAFARGSKGAASIGTRERLQGRGRIVITASDALQYAFEGSEITGEGVQSVFTRALVKGLETGDADLNHDGRISLDELYDYVYDRVLDESPTQRPGKWSFDVEGQVYIARAVGGPRAAEDSAEVSPEAPLAAPTPGTPRARPGSRWRDVPRRWVGAGAAVAAVILIVVILALSSSSSPSQNSSSGNLARPPAVVNQFLDAWKAGDRASAGRVAAAGAVAKIFAIPYPSTGVQFQDPCYGLGTGQYSCEYNYFSSAAGNKHFQIDVGRWGNSYRVIDVRSVSD